MTTDHDASALPIGRAATVAFVTAFATLSVQILVHRMVSAKLLNNYAFLVISLTMLGFALSGVLLVRWLPRVLSRLEDALVAWSALFAITAVGASIIFYRAGTAVYLTRSRAEFFDAFIRTMPLALLYALPFAFAGLILGALLSSPALPARRIYCWDLLGSAAGALVILPAIRILGVETSLLLVCGLGVAVPLLLAPPRKRTARALAALALTLVVVTGVGKDRVFEMSYPAGSMLAIARDPSSGWVIEHRAWDPIAHIEVLRIRPPDIRREIWPALIGSNPEFWPRIRLMLTQNNWAFTLAPHYDGSRASLVGIDQTVFAAPYQAGSVARPRVFVIGVGGGSDILAALAFDAANIVAAEVNAATVGILKTTYRDYFRHWVEDPRVGLVNAEGRSLLAATQGPFDVITVSGVDSYSGTPAAAHVFSENYLYTEEAFDLYLRRLSQDGILSVQRMEHAPPREMLRALVTAVAALRRSGVARPAEHVVMLTTVTGGRFVALLVKKTPFTETEQRRIAAWASATGLLGVSAAPLLNAQGANAYQVFLTLGSAEREEAFAGFYLFDIAPVSDDRPFFFHFAFWWHLLARDPVIVHRSIPAMQYSVLLLLGIVGVVAVACVALPLRRLRRADPAAPPASRYGVFFAAIAVGYLTLELALIQKFGLFLGHPNYALSVVLAALLFGTGLGSLAAERLLAALRGLRFVGYVLALLVLVEHVLIFPWMMALPPLPVPVKAAIVAALVIPVGACLGVFMPVGLERLKARNPALAPWAWGVNGIFSVLAPIAGVGVSMTWGISALLLSAIPAYLVAVFVMPAGEPPVPDGAAGSA